MIDINELRDRAATFGSDYLTDEEWVEVIDRLEAAEKDIALKEKIIDALGSELNAVAKERDALQAKIEAMEKQGPVGTLHDDGHFVWSAPRPYESNYAGWKMKLYTLPGAKGE